MQICCLTTEMRRNSSNETRSTPTCTTCCCPSMVRPPSTTTTAGCGAAYDGCAVASRSCWATVRPSQWRSTAERCCVVATRMMWTTTRTTTTMTVPALKTMKRLRISASRVSFRARCAFSKLAETRTAHELHKCAYSSFRGYIIPVRIMCYFGISVPQFWPTARKLKTTNSWAGRVSI